MQAANHQRHRPTYSEGILSRLLSLPSLPTYSFDCLRFQSRDHDFGIAVVFMKRSKVKATLGKMIEEAGGIGGKEGAENISCFSSSLLLL